MASFAFNYGMDNILNRNINWVADVIKVALFGSNVPGVQNSQDAANLSAGVFSTNGFQSDYELNIGGYAPGFGGAGRKTLTGLGLQIDTVNNRVRFTAANPSAWTLAAGATVYGALIYKHLTSDTVSIPIWFIDCTDTPTNGGAFTFQFHADGVGAINNIIGA